MRIPQAGLYVKGTRCHLGDLDSDALMADDPPMLNHRFIPRHILRAMLPGIGIALGVILYCGALGYAVDAYGATTPNVGTPTVPTAHAVRLHCAEDSPSHCWDWYRMGNHARGWVGPWGTLHVGHACRFARALAHGRIFRYHRTQVLRGDRAAIRAAIRSGCVKRSDIARALGR